MDGVRPGRFADQEAAVACLVEAFAADPVLRWFFPERYAEQATAFFTALYALRLMGGVVWVNDAVSAVALWDPPGGRTSSRGDDARIWHETTSGHFDPLTEARLDDHHEMVKNLFPAIDHWYLGVLGVATHAQRQGLGRAVLEPVLADADRAGVPAALETGSEDNVAVYRRLGFELWTESTHHDGPRIWLMWREGRPTSTS
jgi:GNAT superfamily N-acetyltransferase